MQLVEKLGYHISSNAKKNNLLFPINKVIEYKRERERREETFNYIEKKIGRKLNSLLIKKVLLTTTENEKFLPVVVKTIIITNNKSNLTSQV